MLNEVTMEGIVNPENLRAAHGQIARHWDMQQALKTKTHNTYGLIIPRDFAETVK